MQVQLFDHFKKPYTLRMSSTRDYLIVGDSNVRRFHSRLGLQSHNLDFVQARSMEEAITAVNSVLPTYKFVIFAFITNLIVSAGDECANPVDRLASVDELFNTLLQLLR